MDKFVMKSCDHVCTLGTTKGKMKGVEYNKEYDAKKCRRVFQPKWLKRSGKKQADNNFYKNEDTFETKFARHVSVVQQPSSVESRINLKLHLNLYANFF